MGLSSTASRSRPDAGRQSIRSAFVAGVAGPAAILVLLWLACVGVLVGITVAGHGYLAHHQAITSISVAIAGTLVIIAIVALTASFARRLGRDVAGLARTAQSLTAQQAAQAASRGRDGIPAPLVAVAQPPRATAEVARAGAAMIGLQNSAAAAAASEAGLRHGLREVFVSMARRNQSLLQRQLRLIDALEQKASDPAALADLFSLDHLTTRMRRHAESLAILSGAAPGRAWREPVPVIDVIRGAMAEVEDYKRVSVLTRSEDSITGAAVADMIHLLAELIENATLFSPSSTRVEVRAGRVANGFAVEIDDRGLGVEPEQLAEINRQLTSPPDFDLANADRLGLFVGGKLAARHGVRVQLRTSPYGGTTAIVLMPYGIVVPAPGTLPDGQPADGPPAEGVLAGLTSPATARAGHPDGLDLRGGESLALAGRRPPGAAAGGSAGRRSPATTPGLPDPRLADSAAPASTGPLAGPPAGRPRLDLPGAGTPGPGSAPPPVPRSAPPPGPASGTTRPASGGSDVFRRALPSEAGDPRPGPGEDRPGPGEDESYHGLPRRTRQASLSPHLRGGTPASGRRQDAGSGLPPEDIPAPEHARNLASSLQSGWQRGRASGPAGTPGPAGEAEPDSPGTTDSPTATSRRAATRSDSAESASEDG